MPEIINDEGVALNFIFTDTLLLYTATFWPKKPAYREMWQFYPLYRMRLTNFRAKKQIKQTISGLR